MTASRTLALTEELISLSSVTPDDQGCQRHPPSHRANGMPGPGGQPCSAFFRITSLRIRMSRRR